MASVIFASVGSSIGNMILPGLGGRLLGSFARQAGKSVDAELGLTTASKDGARLENFKVQDSRYGVTIPVLYGAVRVAGNVIWVSDLIETAHETAVSGGKGGVISSGLGSTRTTYTYSVHCAVALGFGEIGGIQRIWADSKVIYENGVWTSGIVGSAAFYYGTKDQEVNAFMESCIGGGLAPAYRGMAYIVLESLQISKFGNRLPNLTFEILPKDSTGSPSLTGAANPAVLHNVVTNRQGGMQPLVSAGGDVGCRQVLVGGYMLSGGIAQFVVVEYDVSGETPVELRRDTSAGFSCTGVYEHSWARSKSGRYIAMGMQDTGAGYPYHVLIYDTVTHSFGSHYSVAMTALELRQIAWIDAYRFVVTDGRNTARGVRAFLRSGTSLVDLGFFDVWGSGTASTRLPLAYAQFRVCGDGLLAYAGNASLNFTTLYARYIGWSGTSLTVGAAFTVSSGYSLGSGSSPELFLIPTGEEEWTLFYLTVSDMQMMSFIPTQSSVVITRPWQKIKSAAYILSNSNAPVLYGDRVCIVHRSYTESQYRLSEIKLDAGAFTVVTDAAPVENSTPPASNFGAFAVGSTRLLVLGNSGGTATLAQAALVRRRNTGDTLDQVVGAILERAGYQAEDFDVSALQDTQVDGYALSSQMTAASALEPLQNLARFDLVEKDGELCAVLYGQGDVVEIEEGEAGASLSATQESEPLLIVSRTQQLDLPAEVAVDYLDASLDYETGSQFARRRVTGGARSQDKVTMPVVCTATQARRIAENQLYAVWYQRERFRLFLACRWAVLCPCDTVVWSGRRMQVTSVTLKDGRVQVDAVAALPLDMVSAAYAETPVSASQSGTHSAPTSHAYLMDLPLLRAQDDQVGLYVAISGEEGWRGASLWRASDGVNFTRLSSFATAASSGVATTALAAQSPHYLDAASVLRVQMLRGTLASCTLPDLLAGANSALVGGELIQFQTATLVENGLYDLSGLLRGRRGTEDQTASHVIGEPFVLLTSASLQFLPASLAERGQSYHFRAVSDGGSLDFALDSSVTYNARTLEPYAPVHIVGSRASGVGSDLTLRWIRRARGNAAWVDYIDVPLDEAQELYDVEIMNGTSVLRTVSGVTAPQFVYTAAMQTADCGGSIPPTFTVRVYQRSDRYGRGKKGEASI